MQSIADNAQKIQAEHVTAEANMTAVLGRVDQILRELKTDDRQLKEAMDAKVTAIETAIGEMHALIPPGLTGQMPTGAAPVDLGPLQNGLAELAGRLHEMHGEVVSVKGRVQEIETRQSTAGGDPWQQSAAPQRAAQAPSAPAPAPQQPFMGATAGGLGTTAGGPQAFRLDTPQRRERWPYDERWNFDNKLAKEALFYYDPKDTATWLTNVSNYFIGQCPDAELLLKWAQSFQHTELTQLEVKNCGLAIDADPVQVSQRIWSWLQIPLMGSGTTELDFNNAEKLNGLEVWRRLSVPAAPRSIARRFFLRDKVQQPNQCATLAAVLDQLVQ